MHLGRFGAYLELEEADGNKARTASVPEGIDPSKLDVSLAVRLLGLPRELGTDPLTGGEVQAGVGRRGPYVRKGKSYGALGALDDVWSVTLEEALDLIREREGRVLGTHPENEAPISVKKGRYGPYIELATDQPRRVGIPEGINPSDVGLDLAVSLLELPRTLGASESGSVVESGIWRGRPAVRSGNVYADLGKLDDIWSITLEGALTLLAEKRKARKGRGSRHRKPIRELGAHPDSERQIVLLNGRYGPYVTDGVTNASIPRGQEPEQMTLQAATMLLAKKAGQAKKAGKSSRRAVRGRASASKATRKTAPKATRKTTRKTSRKTSARK